MDENIMIKLVDSMHEKFGISSKFIEFSKEEKKFRIACLLEEVEEYKVADNPEEELDALVDLIVFALGTVERQGWNEVFIEAFQRVMYANMNKLLGPNTKRGGFALDLKKPDGWTPARLDDLVVENRGNHQQLNLKLED